MPEQTLALPLSGAEIKEILINNFRIALDKDCYLNDTASYSWIRGSVSVKLEANDSGITAITREVPFEAGDPEAAGEKTGVRVDLTFVEEPPNVARVNNDLPVPVEQSSPGKPAETKGIRYANAKKVGPTKIVTNIVK
jgi:hypothetical protein